MAAMAPEPANRISLLFSKDSLTASSVLTRWPPRLLEHWGSRGEHHTDTVPGLRGLMVQPGKTDHKQLFIFC